jgi:DNA-binding XRE family transcriptional regulator
MGLRQWRVSAGLTQQELANITLLSRASISNVEKGLYPPSAGLAGKICRGFSKVLGRQVYTWDVWPGDFTPLELAGRQLSVALAEEEAKD